MLLTVVFAVAAAFSNGVNVLTQHTASIGAPRRDKGWHLVDYLFRPRDVTPSEPVPDEHARGRTGADRPRRG